MVQFMGRVQGFIRNESIQQDVPERDVEQSEADHHQSHDGAAAESDLQPLVER